MADTKLSALTTIPAVDRAADLLYIVDNSGGTSNKVTPNTLLGITGDPVGNSDTQTLTNKTITSPNISDPVLSGTLTGTYTIGGTPTFPAAVVTLTGSQTLTNKTLTSPTINTATISNPTLTTDTVSEHTSANGVTVDGLNIKDGKLNTNNSVVTANITDAAVTAPKINFGGSGVGVWWEEVARTTLGSAGDTITVSNIPTRRYLKVLVTLIDTGGTIGATMSLNNDSGSNYARVQATDFGSPSTQTSNGPLVLGTGNVACNQYLILEIQNIATEEKIFEWIALLASTAGAANAPTARRAHGKWANTSDAISRIDITNPGAGDFAVGSEIVVLGHN